MLRFDDFVVAGGYEMSYGIAHQKSSLYTKPLKEFLDLCHDLDEAATRLAQDHDYGRRYAYPGSIRAKLDKMKSVLEEASKAPFTSKGLALEVGHSNG